MKKISTITVLLLNALLAFSQVTYQYDNLYRLKQVSYPNGTSVVYTYDELGNRLQKTIVGTVAVTSVRLNKTAISLLLNQTEQLIATIEPENATNQQVNWSSSDETIVKVSETGLVTALQSGTATITVTTEDGNYTATCDVTVNSSSGIENKNTPEIELYPNPAKGFVILKGAGGMDISIYTSIGHKMYEKNNLNNEEMIAISPWAQGIYLVRITDKEKTTIVKKLVKE